VIARSCAVQTPIVDRSQQQIGVLLTTLFLVTRSPHRNVIVQAAGGGTVIRRQTTMSGPDFSPGGRGPKRKYVCLQWIGEACSIGVRDGLSTACDLLRRWLDRACVRHSTHSCRCGSRSRPGPTIPCSYA
jgi:hypothetical protein